MIRINRNPGRKDLLVFGALLVVFVALVGSIAYFRRDSPVAARWIWTVGTIVAAVYFAVPPWRRWIYLGWIHAAYPIGWTVSHLLLALVYYGVVTPIGLVMRLAGYDPMAGRIDASLDSYWRDHEARTDPKTYFRQF